jgi:hypothetical protein
MLEYIPSYGAPVEHWRFLPATRLASRIILIEQNIKKRTGPALCVLCGGDQGLFILLKRFDCYVYSLTFISGNWATKQFVLYIRTMLGTFCVTFTSS